jgi:hypothetical protein
LRRTQYFSRLRTVSRKTHGGDYQKKTKQDWACFLEQIANQYKSAEKITLLMDNLNTHSSGSPYETFQTDKAKALWERFEFVYTPNIGVG